MEFSVVEDFVSPIGYLGTRGVISVFPWGGGQTFEIDFFGCVLVYIYIFIHIPLYQTSGHN